MQGSNKIPACYICNNFTQFCDICNNGLLLSFCYICNNLLNFEAGAVDPYKALKRTAFKNPIPHCV